MTVSQHSKLSRAFEQIEAAKIELAALRDELGRSDEGRQAAILATNAEVLSWQVKGLTTLTFDPSNSEDEEA